MNLFDILIILILIFGLIRGFIRGLFGELSSMIGVSLGFCIAYCYYDVLVLKLPPWLSNYSYINVLSFLFIFLLITFSIGFISLLIKHIMNLNKIGKLSRTFGSFLGLLEGSLIISIFVLILTTFFPRNIEFIKNSQLSPYLIQVPESIVSVTPHNMRLALFSKIRRFKHNYWEQECGKEN